MASLGVEDHEFDVALNHLTEVVERHVTAGRRVVEPAVSIFLDDDRPVAVALLFAVLVGASQVPVPFRSCALSQAFLPPADSRGRRGYPEQDWRSETRRVGKEGVSNG